MSRRLTCVRGHQWEATVPLPPGQQDTQPLCPICGAAPVALPASNPTATLGAPTARLQPAGQVGGATAATSVAMVPEALAGRPLIPGYEILDELGRGGMGVVYKARQVRLRRLVALKMILSGPLAGTRELARFRAEGEAVARLQHPNIVQIHEVGEHAGRPYFSLEFVEGGNLAQKLAGQPLPPRAAAQLLESLALAVQHAHQQGIIHRDLKPANILLVSGGVVSGEWCPEGKRTPSTTHQPKITDFGLAKQLDSADDQTNSNAILGTPSYMAPEQAMGQNRQVGPAVDIYALGAILYETLTGRPPFRSETSLDTMLRVASEEPVAPTRLRREVPRDLETICLKCLRKEPANRYASAQALAEDLHRFLAGEPIQARPVGAGERLVKWTKRRPAVAALLAVLVVSSVLGALGVAWTWRALDQQRRQNADADRLTQGAADAEAQALKTVDTNRYLNLIASAERECSAGNAVRADQILDDCPAELRDWEWRYLKRLCQWGALRTIAAHDQPVLSVAFSPDGKRLASAGADATVKIWDSATGKLLLTYTGHKRTVTSLAFSPDSRRVVSASEDRSVRLWDAATGKDAVAFDGHTVLLQVVAFSPDGQRIASGGGQGKTGELKVWDVATGREVHHVAGLTDRVHVLAFGGKGQWLAWGCHGQRVLHLLDTKNGKEIVQQPTDFVGSVAYDPTGRLAAGGWNAQGKGEVTVWDPSGKLLHALGTAGYVRGIAFTADGQRLAAGSGNLGQGEIRLWNPVTGKEVITFRGHAKDVSSVAFAGDGSRLASGSYDGTVKIWDTTLRPADSLIPSVGLQGTLQGIGNGGFKLTLGPARRVPADMVHLDRSSLRLAFSPDGRRLATLEGNGSVALWDMKTGIRTGTLSDPRAGLVRAVFSSDGKQLATLGLAEAGRMVRVWDALTSQPLHEFRDDIMSVGGLVFTPDGLRLASLLPEVKGVKLWDPIGKRAVRTLGEAAVWHPLTWFSPEGRRLGAFNRDGLTVWDAATGKAILSERAPFGTLSFSAAGNTLALIGDEGTVQLWDAATGAKGILIQLPIKGRGAQVHLSPDGRRLACAAPDGKVQVWDAVSGQPLPTLRGHPGSTAAVAFSLDGRRLFTASRSEPVVKVWDVPTGQEILTLRHSSGIEELLLSPDGKRLAAASKEGVKVWDATPLPEGVSKK